MQINVYAHVCTNTNRNFNVHKAYYKLKSKYYYDITCYVIKNSYKNTSGN